MISIILTMSWSLLRTVHQQSVQLSIQGYSEKVLVKHWIVALRTLADVFERTDLDHVSQTEMARCIDESLKFHQVDVERND